MLIHFRHSTLIRSKLPVNPWRKIEIFIDFPPDYGKSEKAVT